MSANVPVFVNSFHVNGFAPTFMMIGKQSYRPPLQDYKQSAWWWALIDLNNLSVLANEITLGGQNVPASVQNAMGNPDIFLICASNYQHGSAFPQGKMSDVLMRVGASKVLPRLEQVVEQAGTGYFVSYSYILAATMSESDLPGFEEYSPNFQASLVFQFMPIQIGSRTVYSPIQTWPNPPSLTRKAAATEAPLTAR
jgi:hypothetical protein